MEQRSWALISQNGIAGSAQTNIGGGQNVYFRVNRGGKVIASADFCVSSRPINFRETTGGHDNGDGTLSFRYEWDSDSGNLADLSGVKIGEIVTYPSVFPNPPFGDSPSKPFTTQFPAVRGFGEDTHFVPLPLSQAAGAIDGTQFYRFRDRRCDRSSWVNIEGPITISRSVAETPAGSGNWIYTIIKSGVTATRNIP